MTSLKIRCGTHTHNLHFCNANEKQSFIEDMAHGLVYGCAHYQRAESMPRCAYCGDTHFGKRTRPSLGEPSRQRLAVSGWRIIEQVPSGGWRPAIEAPRYFKTKEEAVVVAKRLAAKYDRMGHTHRVHVEFVPDVGSPPAFYGLSGAPMSTIALSG
ncbi:MAG: hypothetical protein ABII82_01895, partial [Verrucomicrobiota bacterium]